MMLTHRTRLGHARVFRLLRSRRCYPLPALILTVAVTFVTPTCVAELLPPGDFNGTSFEQWGLDYLQWAIATGLGGQSLPDTVNGARYLPPNFGGGDFVADLTIEPGLGLVGSPFFLFGEQYDTGPPDDPNDPFIDVIFDDAFIRTTYNDVVVLEGTGSELSERMFGISVFNEPIAYEEPQPRGDRFALAAIFGGGIGTIFANLSPGEHTIVNEFDSMFFGSSSFTYNITVVPEPTGLAAAGIAAVGLAVLCRRLHSRGTTA